MEETMTHTAKNTLQKFTEKYKSFREKRKEKKNTRVHRHLLKPEQREKLTGILNKYSLIFHYILACAISFILTGTRLFIQFPDRIHLSSSGIFFPQKGSDANHYQCCMAVPGNH